VDSSVVWPYMLFGPYQCVYGALFRRVHHTHTDKDTYTQPGPGDHAASYVMGTGSFLEVKAAGVWR